MGAVLNLPDAGHKMVGADKACDTATFVAATHVAGVALHVMQAINANHGTSVHGRTTRGADYKVSHVVRRRIEEANGWINQVGGMTHYSLIRLPRLLTTR